MQKPTPPPANAAYDTALAAYDSAVIILGADGTGRTSGKIANINERITKNLSESAALVYGTEAAPKPSAEAQAVLDQLGHDEVSAQAFESVVLNWMLAKRGLPPVEVVPTSLVLKINSVAANPAPIIAALEQLRSACVPPIGAAVVTVVAAE